MTTAPPPSSRPWADALGASSVNVGPRHHIGAQSGVGDWVEGLALFDDFFTATQRG